MLILTGYVQDSVLMVKTLQSLKVNPKLIGFAFAVGIPDVLTALGPAAEDLFGVAIWEPACPTRARSSPTAPPTPTGYKAMFSIEAELPQRRRHRLRIVLQQAITAAGTLEPAKVRDAMSNLDFETFFGKVKFNDTRRRHRRLGRCGAGAERQGRSRLPNDIAAAPIHYPRKPFG